MHKINKGVILSEKGIPQGYKWFCDGRLSFSFDEGGVDCVEYYGERGFDANQIVFKKRIFDCFRVFVLHDGQIFSPLFTNVEIWPFGLTTDWEVQGTVFKFGIHALDESIAFSLSAPPETKDDFSFRLFFYESGQLIPAETGDYLLGTRGLQRTWLPWTWNAEDNSLTGGFEDSAAEKKMKAFFRISANNTISFSRSDTHEARNTLDAKITPGSTTVFALSPGTNKKETTQKNKLLVENFNERFLLQHERYQNIRDKMPQLVCDNPGLSDFFSLAPLYSESLKINTVPGAIRAKTTRYWVWGWDAAVSNLSSLYWFDADFIRDMLDFFEKNASPEFGLAHAYSTDNSSFSPMALSAQGMYICLLHHYFSMSGDKKTLTQFYPFAKLTLERMLTTIVPDNGLMKGMSLYPDFPQAMNETGNDLSLYNNSLAYCSLRAMEFLSGVMGDNENREKTAKINKIIRNNFNKIFFDEKSGAYVNSVDATTFERRPCVNIGSLMWENDFLEELVRKNDETYVKFIEAHCVGTAYFRAIPLWDTSFDGDANQLHCTWPVVEENVMRLMNRQGKTDILKKWASWVAYWTNKLLVPEGISYLIETETPETDRWNCEPGTWQAYTMRQWYQDILHAYLGVSFDYGGVNISPSGVGAYSVSGLYYKGGTINIHCTGSGKEIKEIIINNKKISGTRKIPYDLLNVGGTTSIEITLCDTPPTLEFAGCYNTCITEYKNDENEFSFFIEGAGHAELQFNSINKINILLNGNKINNNEINLKYGIKYKIEVTQDE